MTKKTKQYSEGFKRQVVAEYEAGSSAHALAKKYGITGGSTIGSWIKKYAKEGFRRELIRIQTAEEANRVKELEQQVQQLEQALGKVVLEKLKLESVLEELEETYGVEVKKTHCHHSTIVCQSPRTSRKANDHGSNLCPIWNQSPGALPEAQSGSATPDRR